MSPPGNRGDNRALRRWAAEHHRELASENLAWGKVYAAVEHARAAAALDPPPIEVRAFMLTEEDDEWIPPHER